MSLTNRQLIEALSKHDPDAIANIELMQFNKA